MRKIASLLVAAVASSFCSVASAVPTLFYTPSSGNLILVTDPGVALEVVNIKSPTGKLSAPAAEVLPSSVKDIADLPNFLVLINVPATNGWPGHNLGNIVTPGTPVSDLAFGYWVTSGPGAEQVGYVQGPIPEPGALSMACLALVGVAAASRRKA